MAFFNESYLDAIRADLCAGIASAKYRIGDTLRDAAITARNVNGNRFYIVVSCANLPAGSQTISEVILYDAQGGIVASKLESVNKTLTQGVLFKFEFILREA